MISSSEIFDRGNDLRYDLGFVDMDGRDTPFELCGAHEMARKQDESSTDRIFIIYLAQHLAHPRQGRKSEFKVGRYPAVGWSVLCVPSMGVM